jgi:hypothetical protein
VDELKHWAWPLAFAFVGMCATIAYYNVYAPKDAQIVCIEQRGKWVASWSMHRSTCEFPTAATTAK